MKNAIAGALVATMAAAGCPGDETGGTNGDGGTGGASIVSVAVQAGGAESVEVGPLWQVEMCRTDSGQPVCYDVTSEHAIESGILNVSLDEKWADYGGWIQVTWVE